MGAEEQGSYLILILAPSKDSRQSWSLGQGDGSFDNVVLMLFFFFPTFHPGHVQFF